MIRISLANREISVGNRRLRLTPKFFQLYCLLAYHRAAGRERFLTCRDVHRLSRWNGTSLASVGKAIHRHVREMRRTGRNLIESPHGRTTHLFRLRHASGEISFDLALPDVRAFLGLDLVVPETSPEEVERVVRFATALTRARLEFEKGRLREARAALEEADRTGSCLVRERMQHLVWWSRVLEREGDYGRALAYAQEAASLCDHPGSDYLTAARALIWLGHLGWMSREPGLLRRARAHYLRAQAYLEGTPHFQELAQIATGLGHLARREADWSGAHSYFLSALRYAAAEGWAWGIQAALCNLGIACAERGDRIRDRAARDAAFREAQRWEERCIAFADETGVGHDSTEAVSLLSGILLKRGKGADAIRWARVALERARASGNPKSEAFALESLGQVLTAVGRVTDGHEHLRAAAGLFARLGREDDLQRVNHTLDGRNLIRATG